MRLLLALDGNTASQQAEPLLGLLRARGHSFELVLRGAAANILSHASLRAWGAAHLYSNNPFARDHAGTDHVSSARTAELVAIYGASAELIAQHAHGAASDFLSLQLLATRTPIVLAPEVPATVWSHPAVCDNIARLRARGVVVASADGSLVNPLEFVNALEKARAASPK